WAALCQRHLPAERNRDAALWLLQQLQVDDAIIQESTPTSAAMPPSPETKPPSENLKSDHPATNDTGASNTASSPPLNSAG
ncbi:MAG: hypothetical protein KDJ99_16075, partial [Candidatus Competibacteraceae bacterium]|nr:hypothetical protein [Candidatus Competibacteraceae bacterium]